MSKIGTLARRENGPQSWFNPTTTIFRQHKEIFREVSSQFQFVLFRTVSIIERNQYHQSSIIITMNNTLSTIQPTMAKLLCHLFEHPSAAHETLRRVRGPADCPANHGCVRMMVAALLYSCDMDISQRSSHWTLFFFKLQLHSGEFCAFQDAVGGDAGQSGRGQGRLHADGGLSESVSAFDRRQGGGNDERRVQGAHGLPHVGQSRCVIIAFLQ